jgi:hypothetical protein
MPDRNPVEMEDVVAPSDPSSREIGPTRGPTPSEPLPIPSPARRRRRLLPTLLIVLGTMVVLAGAAGVIVYDQATKIDRSTPAASARQFLRAALTERNVDLVGLFVCDRWPAERALNDVLAGVDVSAHVSYSVGLPNQLDARSATVPARIVTTRGSGAIVGEKVVNWTLDAVDEDGWRICGFRQP